QASVNQLNLAARGTWAPSDLVGVEFQVNGYTYQRDSLFPSAPFSTSAPLGAVNVHRTDMFVRAFAATREDGMGLRFDAQLGSSSYGDTTHALDTLVAQAVVDASYRARGWSGEVWGRLRDNRTPVETG